MDPLTLKKNRAERAYVKALAPLNESALLNAINRLRKLGYTYQNLLDLAKNCDKVKLENRRGTKIQNGKIKRKYKTPSR